MDILIYNHNGHQNKISNLHSDEDASGTKGNAKFQYGWAYLPTTKNLFNQICTFLGPRGPLVLPLSVPSRPVRPALKIWITYIQAYMPYES